MVKTMPTEKPASVLKLDIDLGHGREQFAPDIFTWVSATRSSNPASPATSCSMSHFISSRLAVVASHVKSRSLDPVRSCADLRTSDKKPRR